MIAVTHVWLHNPDTNGYWQCPAEAAEEFVARGWVECDPPPEPNAALAEQIAWRAQMAEQADAEAAVEKAATTKSKSARRGETQED